MFKQSINKEKSCGKILVIIIFISLAFLLTFCTKKTTSPDEQLKAPSNLQITLVENNKIQILWQDNSTNETKFLISRKIGLFSWQENYGEVAANIITFPDEIPTNSDTVYSYKVRAFDGENYSEYSIPTGWFGEIAAPTNLQLEQIAQDSIRLVWIDNSIGELNFRVDRKIGSADWQENYKILEPDTTSYIDYNPSLYDTCYYKVFAVCGNSYSDSTQNYFIPFLPAPTNLAIEALSATSAKLLWQDNCEGEDGYLVYKRLEGTDWNIIDVQPNTEEWIDEDVIPGIVNYYKVCAYIGDDHSGYIEDSLNTLPAPTNLQIEQLNVHTFKLDWQDNSNFEQGFKIDRKIDTEEWINEIGIVYSNITTWTDSTIGKNYEVVFYRVYGYYEEYNSTKIESNSNIVFPAPSNLTYQKLTISSIKLNWTDNSNGENGFKIDKKVGENEWQLDYAIVGENVEEWTDDNAEINETIKYRIYAYSGNNISNSIETGEIDNSFPAPTNLTYHKLTISSIKLNWTDNSNGEDGFKIDKKVGESDWQLEYAILGENIEEWTDGNAEINETIQYRIYAYFGNNISTSIETGEIDNSFPAPTNLTYHKLTISSIKLNWTDNSNGEDGFKIDKKVGENDWQLEYAIVEEHVQEWTDENAEINETIKYRVYAFCGTNSSDFIETEIDNSIPAPLNLEYEILSVNSIKLNWSDNSIGEEGFKIDKKVRDENWQIEYATLDENAIEWTDENVDLINNYYFYRIYSFYENNISFKSEIEIFNTFIKTFGGSLEEHGNSGSQTDDGGFIITGYTFSYGVGNSDIWLIKTDALGDEEWNRTFGGSDWDYGNSVSTTYDGGFVITGSTQSYGAASYSIVRLIKTDTNGNEEWDKTFTLGSRSNGYSVSPSDDGGFIITGYVVWGNHSDVLLIKTDANGNEEWNKTFGGSDDDWGYSVYQTDDGGFIITGQTSSGSSGYDNVWLIKTDAYGNEEWNKTFGGSYDVFGRSGAQTDDGGYIITGNTYSFGAGESDVWLIKTDSQGNEEWNRTFGASEGDYGFSVSQSEDGGFIITGLTNSYGAGEQDVWLIKTDAYGNEEWNRTFGGSDNERGISVSNTYDGGFIITGWTGSYGAGEDVWLIKTDDEGNVE